MREVSITSILLEFDQKKFHNLGLALGMGFKLYIRVAKGLKLKARKLWGLIPAFVEVTGEKLVGSFFGPPILNRVKS